MRHVDIPAVSAAILSAKGLAVLDLNNAAVYSRLVVEGEGHPQAKMILMSATPQELFAQKIKSEVDARAVLAGLWLWHDWLDESHKISQGIDSTTGSYWHAVMHRREGDFANSKYWYDRAIGHPVFGQLAEFDFPNPRKFVDEVERVYDRTDDPRHAAAVRLQRMEWNRLFDYCLRRAVGQ